MAVQNPPAFLQNAGATHTAQVTRGVMTGISATPRVASSLTPRGGVHPGNGNVLVVTQQSSPTMGITVDIGTAYVPGSEATGQGLYACVNSTSTNVAVTAAHASLGRIDIVVFRVYDTQYSGALNQCALEVIAGTPSASPVAPAAPNNSLVLANITVGAAVTSIVNANIADKRAYIPTGITTVETFADLSLIIAWDGSMAFVRNEDTLYTYNSGTWTRDYRRGTPVGFVASATATGAIGTTETIFLSCPSATYKANTAYRLTIECGYVMSTSSNYPVVLTRKNSLAGAVLIDFATRAVNGGTGVVIGDEMSRIFTIGGSDVTTSIVCTIDTLTGTVTVSGASARPRVCHIEEYGRAADFPTHPVLS